MIFFTEMWKFSSISFLKVCGSVFSLFTFIFLLILPSQLALQEKKAAMETQQDPMSASMMAGHAPSVDVIIKPTGGQVKLIRNRSRDPLKSSEGPRVSLEVHLEEIPVEVREEQWGSLVRSGEESVRRWSGRRWRKWKPLAPVSNE